MISTSHHPATKSIVFFNHLSAIFLGSIGYDGYDYIHMPSVSLVLHPLVCQCKIV